MGFYVRFFRSVPLVLIASTLAAGCLRPSAPSLTTFSLPPGTSVQLGVTPALAVSPAGDRVVYVARNSSGTRLYVQSGPEAQPLVLTGTEGAANPFFSPDARWVGFFADGKLKKALLEPRNSVPTVICDAGASRGASWGDDGQIIFAVTGRPELLRVSADGGEAQPLTRPTDQKDFGHLSPHVLPGGKAVLFAMDTGVGFDHAQIAVLSLETGTIRPLMATGHSPSYAAGHLIFARDYTLFAARFDVPTLTVTGPAVRAMANVSMISFFGVGQFSVSTEGVLAYASRDVPEAQRSLVWVDRAGTAKPVTTVKHAYDLPRLSPDGTKLAFVRTETPNDEVWTYDFKADRFTRLSNPSIDAAAPAWSPDSRQVTFSIKTDSGFNVFRALADGYGSRQQLLASPFLDFPSSWSPDGRTLAFSRYYPPHGWDIWVLGPGSEARTLISGAGDQGGARFSPDGRWVGYISTESGQSEVYLQPYPGPGERYRVSLSGGREPAWSPDGQELFFRQGQKLMSARFRGTRVPSIERPTVLFEGSYAPGETGGPNFDVVPDWTNFIMVRSEIEKEHVEVRVVRDWLRELPR